MSPFQSRKAMPTAQIPLVCSSRSIGKSGSAGCSDLVEEIRQILFPAGRGPFTSRDQRDGLIVKKRQTSLAVGRRRQRKGVADRRDCAQTLRSRNLVDEHQHVAAQAREVDRLFRLRATVPRRRPTMSAMLKRADSARECSSGPSRCRRSHSRRSPAARPAARRQCVERSSAAVPPVRRSARGSSPSVRPSAHATRQPRGQSPVCRCATSGVSVSPIRFLISHLLCHTKRHEPDLSARFLPRSTP